MQNLIVSSTLCLLFTLTSPLIFADSVTLKTGETIEGKVLAQTDTQVVIVVKVSASITDRKTISREDIAEIATTAEDTVAFKALERYTLKDNSLAAERYDLIISKKIKPFLSNFPDSTHRADVEKTLAAFEEEKARIEGGELKLDGKWLTAEEVIEQKYELDAILAYREIRDQATRGQLIPALNDWEDYKKNFQGARNFPDTAKLVSRILSALDKDLTAKRAQHEHDAKKWERGYELARTEDKELLKQAHDAEQQRFVTAIAESKAAGKVWIPLNVASKKSLEELTRTSANATRAMLQINIPKMDASIAKVTQAKAAIAREDFDSASKLLREATTLWTYNAEAKALTAGMIDMAKDFDAKKAAALKAEAAALEAEEKKAEARANTSSPAAQAAEAAAAEERASSKKPFYKTIPGAFAILIALVAVIGGLSKLGGKGTPKDEE